MSDLDKVRTGIDEILNAFCYASGINPASISFKRKLELLSSDILRLVFAKEYTHVLSMIHKLNYNVKGSEITRKLIDSFVTIAQTISHVSQTVEPVIPIELKPSSIPVKPIQYRRRIIKTKVDNGGSNVVPETINSGSGGVLFLHKLQNNKTSVGSESKNPPNIIINEAITTEEGTGSGGAEVVREAIMEEGASGVVHGAITEDGASGGAE